METQKIERKLPAPPKMSTRTVRLQHLKLALRVDSGLHIGTLHVLRDGRTLMGRAIDIEVPVDDAKASRMHAAIDYTNGLYWLTDLGSTNGTFLNGRQVQTAEKLTVGDEVRIGSICFRVEILEEAKTQISKIWDEPTKIVMLPPTSDKADKAPKNKIHISQEVSANFHIDQMVKKFKSDRHDFITRHGTWIGVLFVFLVVASALIR